MKHIKLNRISTIERKYTNLKKLVYSLMSRRVISTLLRSLNVNALFMRVESYYKLLIICNRSIIDKIIYIKSMYKNSSSNYLTLEQVDNLLNLLPLLVGARYFQCDLIIADS